MAIDRLTDTPNPREAEKRPVGDRPNQTKARHPYSRWGVRGRCLSSMGRTHQDKCGCFAAQASMAQEIARSSCCPAGHLSVRWIFLLLGLQRGELLKRAPAHQIINKADLIRSQFAEQQLKQKGATYCIDWYRAVSDQSPLRNSYRRHAHRYAPRSPAD